ncbi:MAG TPA: ATP-binding protein [Bacteroidales bacterium]|nr:ATP-binding protein [Bacteroidales bacterium]
MKIAIASGKGGTGKTTLSANLAAFLSENESVVLADLDVEEPNSGLFIRGKLVYEEEKYKMIPNWDEDVCTLCGECQKNCNFHAVIQLGPQILVFPELCHSCYACSELCPVNALPMVPQRMGQLKQFWYNNIDFIESRLDIGQEQAVPLIAQTIEFVDTHFDNDIIQLFDSPPGTSCPVIEATKEADYVILVTEPTPFGLHDLKLAVETMKALKKEFGVVINRYGVGNDDVVEYCLQENIPVLAKIPNSRKVAEIYSKGQLIYDKIPEIKEQFVKLKDFILSLRKEFAK